MKLTPITNTVPTSPLRNLRDKSANEVEGPGDSVSLGESLKLGALKVAKAGAGLLGAGIGGTLGVLPGVTYGIQRKFDTEQIMWNVDTDKLSIRPNHHQNLNIEAQTVDASWKLSYALLGAAVAGTAAYIGMGPGLGTLMSTVAGGALGVGVQAAFRSSGAQTTRIPVDSQYFTATLTHCADKQMGAEIRGPLSGALVGMKEGAYLGKLAFQDLMVPALRPDRYTKYKP